MNAFDQKDEDIYLLLLENQEEGVRVLLVTYERFWRACLRKYYHNKLQDADFDEIISAATWKIWNGINTFDETQSKFRQWALAIVSNLAKDYVRAAKRGLHSITLEAEEWEALQPIARVRGESENTESLTPEARGALYGAFDELPDIQKDVLQIVTENPEISARDISDMLEKEDKYVTNNYVRGLKKRAGERMRNALLPYKSDPKIAKYLEESEVSSHE
jgi:RNA polymerase sigma factor (sigma-70 family)